MYASYWNPVTQSLVEAPGSQISDLVASILQLESASGHPALELRRGDGSSVTLGTDGEWAVVSWVDPLGEAFASVGETPERVLVYDYFGSWSEAPGFVLVPHLDAVRCLECFARNGSPVTERVLFAPT